MNERNIPIEQKLNKVRSQPLLRMLFHLQQSFTAFAVMEVHCPTPEGCADIFHDLFQRQSGQLPAGHAGEENYNP